MSPRVLIVDDSLTVRMDLKERFEAAGLTTLLCATVSEAREAIQHDPLALLVLDVLLPDGDGVDFMAEVRLNPRAAETPIMLLSTEAEVRDRLRGLGSGADEYVGKPYDGAYVVARAKELIRKGQVKPESDSRATVLVIDDSVTYREQLRQAFEAAGYVVLVAGSGEEGLRVAADRRPSAIVVDGVMPGIDGGTVIRRIRFDAALRGTPCLLLTASEDAGAEVRALDSGADAFVRKGEDMEVILAKLSVALRHARGPATAGPVAGLDAPRKILAVDDSQTYLQELADMLRADGYDVILARSGEEAIELLAVQSVDCILLDLVMPGLGGKEACVRIKAAPIVREIPLIMLTGREDRAAMLEGLGAGADDYIPKSSEFEVLKARVRAQIRRKQFEDENRHIREELLRSEFEAAEARAARELAETKAALAGELERKNKELEAFSYSVSHDLRAPLRTIDGFSQALLDDYSGTLDETAQSHLRRVRGAAQRMGQLIDDLLALSRVTRGELRRNAARISEIARSVADELRRKDPERNVCVDIRDGLVAEADLGLVRVLLENLIGNAWKFTSKTDPARIEVSVESRKSEMVFVVRDNGAGFDMTYADKLFTPFQRLHNEGEFPGTGIGLATVYRIVDRHGGRVWAEGQAGQGAAIFFTLPGPAAGALER